ncbi:hypothetical protein HQ545_06915 [Candidatus Woesearchaeota archaeon]|nr:hypothetical protein [Candidatus Woesearchaeota archaeon]
MNRSNRNNFVKMIIFLVLVLMFSWNALALGVGPSVSEEVYEPGKMLRGDIIIINNDHDDFDAEISLEGELLEAISFDTQEVSMISSQESVHVGYNLTMPVRALTPGDHIINIIVRQKGESDAVGATVALITRVIVKVPYPGKYVEGSIYAKSDGNRTLFTVLLHNLGSKRVESASAKIKVIDPAGVLVTDIGAEDTALEYLEQKRVEAEWAPNLGPGEYTAAATLVYDDKISDVEKFFTVGNKEIKIDNIDVGKFNEGKPLQLTLETSHNWNTQLLMRAEAHLIRDGMYISEQESGELNISPGETSKQDIIIENIENGTYYLKLIIHNQGKSWTQSYALEANEGILTITDSDGKIITSSTPESYNILIILLLILLVLFNLAWLYMAGVRKSKKKQGRKRKKN